MRFSPLLVLVLVGCKSAPMPAAEADVPLPPDGGSSVSRIRIEYVGLGLPKYEVTALSIKLDGRELAPNELENLNEAGDHLIFHADAPPGKHSVQSRLHIEDTGNRA